MKGTVQEKEVSTNVLSSTENKTNDTEMKHGESSNGSKTDQQKLPGSGNLMTAKKNGNLMLHNLTVLRMRQCVRR